MRRAEPAVAEGGRSAKSLAAVAQGVAGAAAVVASAGAALTVVSAPLFRLFALLPRCRCSEVVTVVVEWMGCTLERASIHTQERWGVMR